MRREVEYAEIFNITNRLLREKYENQPVPGSALFEAETPPIINLAIAEWNSSHPTSALNIIVEYLGGNKFPDIVLHNNTDSEKIGVEVKFHKTGVELETLGNSTVASTQVEDLAAIFVLFGNFAGNQPEFIIRDYGKCICAITKTHKPRYKLKMDEPMDFCTSNLGISYDELRDLDKDQREIIINSYVATTDYTELSERQDKGRIRAQSFILFPEIFSPDKYRKYKRLGVWLFANNIFCRNVRDFISGSGKRKIAVIGEEKLSKVFYKLYTTRHDIRTEISEFHDSLLKRSWYDNWETAPTIPESTDDRLSMWVDLVCREYGGGEATVEGSPYTFRETIIRLLSDDIE